MIKGFVTAALILFISTCISIGVLAPEKTGTPLKSTKVPTWVLVWEDGFDSETINNSYWNVKDWKYPYNYQLQYYSPRNVSFSNGHLKISTKVEQVNDSAYTSGMLTTKGKKEIKYGKVEIRAKIPKGKGIFPAFWMLPADSEIPLPEIDIMETIGSKTNQIWLTHHWKNAEGKLKTNTKSVSGTDFSEDFHTYTLIWKPEILIWTIDGVKSHTSKNQIPNIPMYLLMNTAVGGNWPGKPDKTTNFPAHMEIDYVRVYQCSKGFDCM